MLVALATLPFLAAIWLGAVVIANLLEQDGAKITAALQGRSLLAEPVVSTRPVVVRMTARRSPAQRPMRVAPQLRAAA